MKGEYLESKNDTNNNNNNNNSANNMFSKLHHHQQHQIHHQNFLPQPFHHHQNLHHHTQFQSVTRECQPTNSEDDDTSRSSGGATTITTPVSAATAANTSAKLVKGEHGDGASIEVVRRPRGRPPGSKNKPKPPIIITREPEPVMSPYILEVLGGADIVETIARFSRRRNIGLCVLTGSGSVGSVTLRQPSNTPGGSFSFTGRFDILSLSATFLSPSTASQIPSSVNNITISLAGPQGQIFGGAVAGPLLAASTVFVIAASFNHPSYHRLPQVEEEGLNNSVSGGTENQSPPASGGVDSGGGSHVQAGDQSCGISMYSCHMPSDVIWAPTPRQPPPPPPPY